MPELFYPIAMLFGILGCMGLWSFSSLCWELARAQEVCDALRDEEAWRIVRATLFIAGPVDMAYFVAMGLCCVQIAPDEGPVWQSWFAAAVSLAVLHSLYMLRTERRLLRFMDCVRSMAGQHALPAHRQETS